MRYFRLLMNLSLLAAFSGLAAPQAAAQSQDYDVRPQASRISGEKLIQTFKGLTHEGAYNFDAKGRPGAYFVERHHSDGRITYEENGVSVKGQWETTPSDTICYRYDSERMGGGCFQVYTIGTCYYFYSAFALPFEDTPQDGYWNDTYWTARTVKKGDSASCEQMIS